MTRLKKLFLIKSSCEWINLDKYIHSIRVKSFEYKILFHNQVVAAKSFIGLLMKILIRFE